MPSVTSVVDSLKPLESSFGLPIVAKEGIIRKTVEVLETSNGTVHTPSF